MVVDNSWSSPDHQEEDPASSTLSKYYKVHHIPSVTIAWGPMLIDLCLVSQYGSRRFKMAPRKAKKIVSKSWLGRNVLFSHEGRRLFLSLKAL